MLHKIPGPSFLFYPSVLLASGLIGSPQSPGVWGRGYALSEANFAPMIKRTGTIAVTAFTLGVLGVGGGFYQSESSCRQSNRCVERLQALALQLEFYSVDHVYPAGKAGRDKGGKACYPASLANLMQGDYHLTADNVLCPSKGVKYVYRVLERGSSFVLYCPGPHTMHFSKEPFYPAVTPDDIRLKLSVKNGRVMDLCGAPVESVDVGNERRVKKVAGQHENPWVPGGTPYAPVVTRLQPDLLSVQGSEDTAR